MRQDLRAVKGTEGDRRKIAPLQGSWGNRDDSNASCHRTNGLALSRHPVDFYRDWVSMGYDYTHISAMGQTDVGRVRQHNEDSIGVHSDAAWFCVADGMGGEEAGEVASALVIKSLGCALDSMPDREGFEHLHAKQELVGRGLRDAYAGGEKDNISVTLVPINESVLSH